MSEDDLHLDPHKGEHDALLETSSENALIYGFYSQITSHKEYCSSMQNRYRALTSTWVLAGFFGIGHLLSGYENLYIPFSSLFGVLILCVCVGFGVTLLWFLDVVLYQRFWLGTVVELARLEHHYSWLPKCNLNILMMRRSKKFRSTQSFFYIAINYIFILISFTLWMPQMDNIYQIALLSILVFLVLWAVTKLMRKKSGEFDVITINSFR